MRSCESRKRVLLCMTNTIGRVSHQTQPLSITILPEKHVKHQTRLASPCALCSIWEPASDEVSWERIHPHGIGPPRHGLLKLLRIAFILLTSHQSPADCPSPNHPTSSLLQPLWSTAFHCTTNRRPRITFTFFGHY
jgi:hypothetical protein